MTVPLSRPKIHRLPAAPSRDLKKTQPLSVSVLFALAAGLVAITANHMIAKDYTANPAMADAPEMLPVTPTLANPAPSEKSSSTIVIKGQEGSIIGQMAKIPVQNLPITEVNTVSNVDKTSGRELLSIVNKY